MAKVLIKAAIFILILLIIHLNYNTRNPSDSFHQHLRGLSLQNCSLEIDISSEKHVLNSILAFHNQSLQVDVLNLTKSMCPIYLDYILRRIDLKDLLNYVLEFNLKPELCEFWTKLEPRDVIVILATIINQDELHELGRRLVLAGYPLPLVYQKSRNEFVFNSKLAEEVLFDNDVPLITFYDPYERTSERLDLIKYALGLDTKPADSYFTFGGFSGEFSLDLYRNVFDQHDAKSYLALINGYTENLDFKNMIRTFLRFSAMNFIYLRECDIFDLMEIGFFDMLENENKIKDRGEIIFIIESIRCDNSNILAQDFETNCNQLINGTIYIPSLPHKATDMFWIITQKLKDQILEAQRNKSSAPMHSIEFIRKYYEDLQSNTSIQSEAYDQVHAESYLSYYYQLKNLSSFDPGTSLPETLISNFISAFTSIDQERAARYALKTWSYENLNISEALYPTLGTREIALNIFKEILPSSIQNETRFAKLSNYSLDLLQRSRPLELILGDDAVGNKILKSIFEDELFSAPVKVISIVGPQKNGKSTLINMLFGTNFEISPKGRIGKKGIQFTMIRDTKNNQDLILLDSESLKLDEENRINNILLTTFLFSISDLVIINTYAESEIPVELIQIYLKALNILGDTPLERKIYLTVQSLDIENEFNIENMIKDLKRRRFISELKGKRLEEINNLLHNVFIFPSPIDRNKIEYNNGFGLKILDLRQEIIPSLTNSSSYQNTSRFFSKAMEDWKNLTEIVKTSAVKDEKSLFSMADDIEMDIFLEITKLIPEELKKIFERLDKADYIDEDFREYAKEVMFTYKKEGLNKLNAKIFIAQRFKSIETYFSEIRSNFEKKLRDWMANLITKFQIIIEKARAKFSRAFEQKRIEKIFNAKPDDLPQIRTDIEQESTETIETIANKTKNESAWLPKKLNKECAKEFETSSSKITKEITGIPEFDPNNKESEDKKLTEEYKLNNWSNLNKSQNSDWVHIINEITKEFLENVEKYADSDLVFSSLFENLSNTKIDAEKIVRRITDNSDFTLSSRYITDVIFQSQYIIYIKRNKKIIEEGEKEIQKRIESKEEAIKIISSCSNGMEKSYIEGQYIAEELYTNILNDFLNESNLKIINYIIEKLKKLYPSHRDLKHLAYNHSFKSNLAEFVDATIKISNYKLNEENYIPQIYYQEIRRVTESEIEEKKIISENAQIFNKRLSKIIEIAKESDGQQFSILAFYKRLKSDPLLKNLNIPVMNIPNVENVESFFQGFLEKLSQFYESSDQHDSKLKQDLTNLLFEQVKKVIGDKIIKGCGARCPICGEKCHLESDGHAHHESDIHNIPAFRGYHHYSDKAPYLKSCNHVDNSNRVWKLDHKNYNFEDYITKVGTGTWDKNFPARDLKELPKEQNDAWLATKSFFLDFFNLNQSSLDNLQNLSGQSNKITFQNLFIEGVSDNHEVRRLNEKCRKNYSSPNGTIHLITIVENKIWDEGDKNSNHETFKNIESLIESLSSSRYFFGIIAFCSNSSDHELKNKSDETLTNQLIDSITPHFKYFLNSHQVSQSDVERKKAIETVNILTKTHFSDNLKDFWIIVMGFDTKSNNNLKENNTLIVERNILTVPNVEELRIYFDVISSVVFNNDN